MRLDIYNSDDFSPLPRQDGDIWVRGDLQQVRMRLNGNVIVLFNADGTPGKLPDNVVRK